MDIRSLIGLPAKSTPIIRTIDPGTYSREVFMSGIERLIGGQSAATMYEQQPHLRTVIDFLAENTAQLGVHVFEMEDNGNRVRSRDNVVAKLLDDPNKDTTTYELIYGIVADWALNDVAYVWVYPTIDPDRPYCMRNILVEDVVGTKGTNKWDPDFFVVRTASGDLEDIPSSEIIKFNGWSPTNAKSGTSKMGNLKAILTEQMLATAARQQLWKNGGRINNIISRPKELEGFTDAQQRKFMAQWRSQLSGSGPNAGGDVLLQEGMTVQKMERFSAKEEGYVEGSELSLSTVAQVYHVNPTMVGVMKGATYSNVREFNRSLYTETLGPILRMLKDRLTKRLLPMVDAPKGTMIEFNVMEKLNGSFEEQAGVMSTMVGAPVMTRNEGRKLFNLPRIEDPDYDKLVTPLNVLIGGQASPRDSAPPKALGPGVSTKGKSSDDQQLVNYQLKVEEVLGKFFKRQGASVLGKLGAKADDEWWDAERWNTELGDDLVRLGLMITQGEAVALLEANGIDPEVYGADQTIAWLTATSTARAEMINNTTKAQLDESIANADEANTPKDVFKLAATSRAATAAVGLVTVYSAFGKQEAAKQSGKKATKTWVTKSSNPRKAHAKMNGETVNMGEKFSNRAEYPGDRVLGADGVAGCTCGIKITFP
jgi:HK97 family phage portal protein